MAYTSRFVPGTVLPLAYGDLTSQLPKQIYNVGSEYVPPQTELGTVSGNIPPGATFTVLVNGQDQFPTQNLTADDDGNFSVLIQVPIGESRIQVQYFPPDLVQDMDENALGAGAADMTEVIA